LSSPRPAGRILRGTVRDDEAMDQALDAGVAARRRTAPNPWVGCVIVRDGEIVGRGATEPPGQAHAEVVALRDAGERARGATAYVTLEPCSHHGRTPPCADALIEAGVACVVVALEDPDPRVAGSGLARLRDAGIDVTVGASSGCAADLAPRHITAAPAGRSWSPSRDEHRRACGRRRRIIPMAHVGGALMRTSCAPTARRSSSARAPRHRRSAAHGARYRSCEPHRCVSSSARGSVPATGPLFDSGLASDGRDLERASPRRSTSGVGAKVEVVTPSSTRQSTSVRPSRCSGGRAYSGADRGAARSSAA
jgi:pyrimidine deaminase RibD-like protein